MKQEGHEPVNGTSLRAKRQAAAEPVNEPATEPATEQAIPLPSELLSLITQPAWSKT